MSYLLQQGAQPQDNRTTFIYGLGDPRTDFVRYVGKSNDPQNRYSRHLAHYILREGNRRTTPWIKELLALGFKPVLKILEETTFQAWEECEKKWIAYFRSIPGYPPLINGTRGGGYTYRAATRKGIKRRRETTKRGLHRHAVEQPIDQTFRVIPLTRGMNSIVSVEKYEFISQWNWFAEKTSPQADWYARRHAYIDGKRVRIFMHSVLLPDADLVDHINGDTLDNRDENLRPVARAQNAWNRKTPSTSISGVKGVSRSASDEGWSCHIMHNGKQFYLGLFGDKSDAARCYDRKAIELFGEYARTNFPVSEYAEELPATESSKASRRTARKRKNPTSQFTGVCFVKREKRWLATIWYSGKQVRL